MCDRANHSPGSGSWPGRARSGCFRHRTRPPHATSVNISGEADHLLRPDECVCQVIRHAPKTCVAEHGKFVQPGVMDRRASRSQQIEGLGKEKKRLNVHLRGLLGQWYRI